MKVLLDTHIILWAVTDDERLPEKARFIISQSENEIYYSTASIWEVMIKHINHPEHMPISGIRLSTHCRKAGYRMLPVQDEHVYELGGLKRGDGAPEHKDPFDRIMIAQAKAENIMFVTHDALIPYYEEKCIVFV